MDDVGGAVGYARGGDLAYGATMLYPAWPDDSGVLPDQIYPHQFDIAAAVIGVVNVRTPSPTVASSQPMHFALQGIATGIVPVAVFTTDLASLGKGGNPFGADIDWHDGKTPTRGLVSIAVDPSNPTVATITVSIDHTFPTGGATTFDVTLYHTSGSFAVAHQSFTVDTEVTDRVNTQISGPTYNAQTQLYYYTISNTNKSSNSITGPLPILISGLPGDVTLVNASGTTFNDGAYIKDMTTSLAPGMTSEVQMVLSNPTPTPISPSFRVFDPLPGAAPDALTVVLQSIVAFSNVPFTGTVAKFTDTDGDPVSNFTATIDWGDGKTSDGAVTADPDGGFDVAGTHTFAQVGFDPITVEVNDSDGDSATGSGTSTETSSVGDVTYHVSVNTATLAGLKGAIAVQFNPAALPGTQTATATVSNFMSTGGAAHGAVVRSGQHHWLARARSPAHRRFDS